MSSGQWDQLAIAAYAAALSTVVAARGIARGRRKLHVVVRVAYRDTALDDNPTADSPTVSAGTSGTLTATMVNTGARPVGISAVGLMVRRRHRNRMWVLLNYGKALRRAATREGQRSFRATRLYVPMLSEQDDQPVPRTIADGESVTVSWSLIRPPFKNLVAHGVFVEDVTGKRRSFRIPGAVRKEANRVTGKIYRQVGPMFGGAVTETEPVEIDEGIHAVVGDHVVFVDQEAALRRLAHTMAFPSFRQRVRDHGYDLSRPLRIVTYTAYATESEAKAGAQALRERFVGERYTVGIGEMPEKSEWLTVLLADLLIREPETASFDEAARQVAANTNGTFITFGVALDDAGRSLLPFVLPKHGDNGQDSASGEDAVGSTGREQVPP